MLPATRFTSGLIAIGLVSILFSGVSPVVAQGAEPSKEAERVDRLERELEAIRAEIARMKAKEAEEKAMKEAGTPAGEAGDRLTEIERRIDILAQELEKEKAGANIFRKAEKSEHGLGVAASKIYQAEQGLTIGGYGEVLYQAFDSTRDDGAPSGDIDELDALRGVLYFGYKFNDKWLFNSEIEFEHGSTASNGSASLEFAYIDYLHRPEFNVRAGLLLIPMGFVNELHEPPLFLGATRPRIENRIIPTTWRENGFGFYGDLGPFTYRTYLVNGLNGSRFSSNGLRGGRQRGSEALAEDFAWTGRIDYTGTAGLLAGISFYVGDSGQGLLDGDGRVIGAKTTLFDAHIEWKYKGLEVRALAVKAEVDDVVRLNEALGLSGSSSIGDELQGYYLQLGYDVLAHRGGRQALIPYTRFESFDTQESVPTGFSRNPARSRDIVTLGLAYKPIDQLIFKGDFQNFDNDSGTGVDQFNLAIGYLF